MRHHVKKQVKKFYPQKYVDWIKGELRSRRARMNITQIEAANILAVHQQTYVKAETYGIFTQRTEQKILDWIESK